MVGGLEILDFVFQSALLFAWVLEGALFVFVAVSNIQEIMSIFLQNDLSCKNLMGFL